MQRKKSFGYTRCIAMIDTGKKRPNNAYHFAPLYWDLNLKIKKQT